MRLGMRLSVGFRGFPGALSRVKSVPQRHVRVV
jgi:hypothetical protein